MMKHRPDYHRNSDFPFWFLIGLSTLVGGFSLGWMWKDETTRAALPPVFAKSGSQLQGYQDSNTKNHKSVQIKIHVIGAVYKPAVISLPANARVMDAIRKAGGPTPKGNIAAINLAAKLEDGEQVRVPVKGEVALAGNDYSFANDEINRPKAIEFSSSLSEKSALAPRDVVNVNLADVAALETLPGVGPAIAARIIEHRTRLGKFRNLGDLDEVKGLGPKKLEKIRPRVRFQ